MKQTKLWQVKAGGEGKLTIEEMTSVESTATETQLEEMLVHHPDLLFKDLKLVGRQTETAGGPLDLLGVDGDGRLVVFELKRGTLTREAVAQVIDYTSDLYELDADEIAKHISDRSGKMSIEKIEDFDAWYQEQFARDFDPSRRPRMVLVGLGVDNKARRMVSFLAESDIDISLITFQAFEDEGMTFLSRQVEVEGGQAQGISPRTKKENLEQLYRRVRQLNIEDFYQKMADFFRDRLTAYEWPNLGGFSYYLPEPTESGSESNRVYVSLYISDSQPGKVEVRVHPRAVEAAKGDRSKSAQQIPNITMRHDGAASLTVNSLEEWNGLLPVLEAFCQDVLQGWKAKRERQENVDLMEEKEIDNQSNLENVNGKADNNSGETIID